jgi:hypothetical protein
MGSNPSGGTMGYSINEIRAYEKGYRATKDGRIIGPRGERKLNQNNQGYSYFTVNIEGKIRCARCHRLQAYQKFGDEIFKEGVHVRHMNGDPMDFSWDNLEIGTQSDNMMDRDPQARHEHAKMAGRTQRRFTDDEIRDIRNKKAEGLTLSQIQETYKTSKGHLSDIINRKIFSDVT